MASSSSSLESYIELGPKSTLYSKNTPNWETRWAVLQGKNLTIYSDRNRQPSSAICCNLDHFAIYWDYDDDDTLLLKGKSNPPVTHPDVHIKLLGEVGRWKNGLCRIFGEDMPPTWLSQPDLQPASSTQTVIPLLAKKHALLIANSNYAKAKDRLVTPQKNMKALQERWQKLGFETRMYEDLIDAKIQKFFEEWANNLDSSSVAVFCFDGHGCETPKTGIQILGTNDKAVKFSKLMDTVRARSPMYFLTILECCRDGAKAFRCDSGAHNQTTIFSCQEGEVASDRASAQGLSPFISTLIENVRLWYCYDILEIVGRVFKGMKDAGVAQSPCMSSFNAFGKFILESPPPSNRTTAKITKHETSGKIFIEVQPYNDAGSCIKSRHADFSIVSRLGANIVESESPCGTFLRWAYCPPRSSLTPKQDEISISMVHDDQTIPTLTVDLPALPSSSAISEASEEHESVTLSPPDEMEISGVGLGAQSDSDSDNDTEALPPALEKVPLLPPQLIENDHEQEPEKEQGEQRQKEEEEGEDSGGQQESPIGFEAIASPACGPVDRYETLDMADSQLMDWEENWLSFQPSQADEYAALYDFPAPAQNASFVDVAPPQPELATNRQPPPAPTTPTVTLTQSSDRSPPEPEPEPSHSVDNTQQNAPAPIQPPPSIPALSAILEAQKTLFCENVDGRVCAADLCEMKEHVRKRRRVEESLEALETKFRSTFEKPYHSSHTDAAVKLLARFCGLDGNPRFDFNLTDRFASLKDFAIYVVEKTYRRDTKALRCLERVLDFGDEICVDNTLYWVSRPSSSSQSVSRPSSRGFTAAQPQDGPNLTLKRKLFRKLMRPRTTPTPQDLAEFALRMSSEECACLSNRSTCYRRDLLLTAHSKDSENRLATIALAAELIPEASAGDVAAQENLRELLSKTRQGIDQASPDQKILPVDDTFGLVQTALRQTKDFLAGVENGSEVMAHFGIERQQ